MPGVAGLNTGGDDEMSAKYEELKQQYDKLKKENSALHEDLKASYDDYDHLESEKEKEIQLIQS